MLELVWLPSFGAGIKEFICDSENQLVWLPRNWYQNSIENSIDFIPCANLILLGTLSFLWICQMKWYHQFHFCQMKWNDVCQTSSYRLLDLQFFPFSICIYYYNTIIPILLYVLCFDYSMFFYISVSFAILVMLYHCYHVGFYFSPC